MSIHAQYLTHRRSRRHADHAYTDPGWYFVTICTRHRRPFFGEIRAGVMGLNEIGCMAHTHWNAIPDHVRHMELGAFIVMPNHVHGLIQIIPDDVLPPHASASDGRRTRRCMQRRYDEHDAGAAAMPRRRDGDGPIPPQAGSLSAVVRSYKSAVTRAARSRRIDFAWQPRFHDHVIRDDEALARIHEYIVENPLLWTQDRYHLEPNTSFPSPQ